MTKIITAINDSMLNNELREEENVEVICRDIQYKEGILEILENNLKIDYIIIDESLPGEIELINLIENILEKNEKIKIIITINKKNKFNLNIENKNIIKIFYENKLNLNKLKNYKNNIERISNKLNKINNKKINKNELNIKNEIKEKNTKKINNKINNNKFKIKDKLNIKYRFNINNKLIKKIVKKNEEKNKIITVLGEPNIGKSMFSIIVGFYLKNKNNKILLIELNENNSNIYTILGCKKFNKINYDKIKYKNNKLKNNYKKINKKYFNKNIKKYIGEKLIIKINKNLDLLSYNKLINFNLIKKLKLKYNYILIEINLNRNKIKNKKIINYSDRNILLIKPNLIGIKNSKKIINKNKIKNNLKIIINNYNKYSIDEKILKKIFFESEIIGKVKSNIEFENFINKNFKIEINKNKSFVKEIEPIIEKII